MYDFAHIPHLHIHPHATRASQCADQLRLGVATSGTAAQRVDPLRQLDHGAAPRHSTAAGTAAASISHAAVLPSATLRSNKVAEGLVTKCHVASIL